MQRTPRRFVRQSVVLPCASCRLRLVSNRPCCLCTVPPGLRQRTHRAGEPNTRTAGRVRYRNSSRYQQHCQTFARYPRRRRERSAGVFRQLLQRLGDHLKELDRQVDELSGQIQLWHKENELSLKLADIPGIGR